MFVCFNLTADEVGKTDFSGELKEEDFLTKGDAAGVGDPGVVGVDGELVPPQGRGGRAGQEGVV